MSRIKQVARDITSVARAHDMALLGVGVLAATYGLVRLAYGHLSGGLFVLGGAILIGGIVALYAEVIRFSWSIRKSIERVDK